MKVLDKDYNYLTLLPDKLKLDIGDILEINEETYIIEKIIKENEDSRKIQIFVDTLLNHKLHHHILDFTYEYYTPQELQIHLNKIGLEIKLMDNFKDIENVRLVKSED